MISIISSPTLPPPQFTKEDIPKISYLEALEGLSLFHRNNVAKSEGQPQMPVYSQSTLRNGPVWKQTMTSNNRGKYWVSIWKEKKDTLLASEGKGVETSLLALIHPVRPRNCYPGIATLPSSLLLPHLIFSTFFLSGWLSSTMCSELSPSPRAALAKIVATGRHMWPLSTWNVG